MAKPLAAIERSIHSQNGEDGIIAFLLSKIGEGDRTLVEIGAGSGGQNNSRALLDQGWRGVLFERRLNRAGRLRKQARTLNWNAEIIDAPADIGMEPWVWRPTLLSLDIDSYDWHVAASLLARGFRPALAVVEYNPTLDPEPVAVPYGVKCDAVYFGASLAAWRALFARYGYRFVTVCSAGINAFFLRDCAAPADIDWLTWADSVYLRDRFGPRARRRPLIGDRPLEVVA